MLIMMNKMQNSTEQTRSPSTIWTQGRGTPLPCHLRHKYGMHGDSGMLRQTCGRNHQSSIYSSNFADDLWLVSYHPDDHSHASGGGFRKGGRPLVSCKTATINGEVQFSPDFHPLSGSPGTELPVIL